MSQRGQVPLPDLDLGVGLGPAPVPIHLFHRGLVAGALMDIHPLHREAPGHVPVLKLVPIHTRTRNQSTVLDLAVSLHLL